MLLEAMIARALQLFQAILDVREAAWLKVESGFKLTLSIWSGRSVDHVTGPYIQCMTAVCLTLVFFVGFSWCIDTKHHAHIM